MMNHAVAVLITTPEGIPLVRDARKPSPVFWKLPGGRSIGDESARECGIREVREELGVEILPEQLTAIYEKDRGTHWFTVFHVTLPQLPTLKPRGDEGEEIAVFTPAEILAKDDFFPNHRVIVDSILAGL